MFYNFKIFVHYLRKEVKFRQIKSVGFLRLPPSRSGSKISGSIKMLVIDREKENVVKSVAFFWTIDDTGF